MLALLFRVVCPREKVGNCKADKFEVGVFVTGYV